MGIFDKIVSAGYVVSAGLDLWIDPPRVRKARLVREPKRSNYQRPLGPQRTQPASASANAAPVPRTRAFRMTLPMNGDDNGYETCLTVNLDTKRVVWRHTDSSLFNLEHKGSGAIGILILSLPTSILASPYILLRMRVLASQEEKHGMSRHGIAILKALDDQLSSEERELLTETFRNEWAARKRQTEKPSWIESEALLKSLQLTESQWTKEGTDEYGEQPGTEYRWFDAVGDELASGVTEADGTCSVRVLGSHFIGSNASRLTKCYAKRRYILNGDPTGLEEEETDGQ